MQLNFTQIIKEFYNFSFNLVPTNLVNHKLSKRNDDIQHFCKVNFGVTFPVMAKANVRGENVMPVFKYMTEQQGFKGFPESDMTEMLTGHLQANFPEYLEGDSIKWNFTKFLINKKGEVVERFEPMVAPEEMESAIEKLLAE